MPTAGRVAWYREHGRPVTIVIPSYRDAEQVATLVAEHPQDRARAGWRAIIVADDASGPEHVAALRAIEGIEVVAGERERRLRRQRQPRPARRRPRARRGGAQLRHRGSPGLAGLPAVRRLAGGRRRRSSAPVCSTPTGASSSPAPCATSGAPEWFDHRYRFKPEDWGPAGMPGPVLAVTGACMYITREPRSSGSGCSTSATRWPTRTSTGACAPGRPGLRVLYFPAARLYHHESVTRGTDVGERERASQRLFWERWGDFFDARDVRTDRRASCASST